MKAPLVALFFVAAAFAQPARDVRQTATKAPAIELHAAAGEDKRLSLAEIESVVGHPDSIAASPKWKESELRIYLLTYGRKLEVTRHEQYIYWAVIVTKTGNVLIWK